MEKQQIASAMQHAIETLREAAEDQFRIYTGQGDIEVRPSAITELPFYQQLAHILVSGEDLELNFKTHFMIDDARRYAAAKLRKDDVTNAQVTDFIKEYCNLVAGKAKHFLEEQHLVVGQSLPYAIQGFNEMFYPRTNGLTAVEAWEVTGAKGAFRCSCTLNLFRTQAATALMHVSYEKRFGRESGDIELF